MIPDQPAKPLDVEARSFVGVGEADLLYGFRRDGYLSVAVSRHF